MPGGALHWPLWVPYELYGKVDYIYGWKAFNEHNGFTAAQGALNCVETLCYLYYLYVLFAHGRQAAAHGRSVEGPQAGIAVLVVFSAAVMTLSKTVLYCTRAFILYEEQPLANSSQGSMSTSPASKTSATTTCRTCF
jgi:hypothetical protein